MFIFQLNGYLSELDHLKSLIKFLISHEIVIQDGYTFHIHITQKNQSFFLLYNNIIHIQMMMIMKIMTRR